MYHGTPDERAELRRTVMAPPKTRIHTPKSSPAKSKSKSKAKVKAKAKKQSSAKAGNEESADKEGDESRKAFPIVVTTYEMIIKDRVALAPYEWGYIVVDEGHRLKNLDCKLMREIKKYNTAGRMILTGTPLQVRKYIYLWCKERDY
jgi:ATP-dependent DNA helicase